MPPRAWIGSTRIAPNPFAVEKTLDLRFQVASDRSGVFGKGTKCPNSPNCGRNGSRKNARCVALSAP